MASLTTRRCRRLIPLCNDPLINQDTDRAEEHVILIKSSIPVDTLLHAIQVDYPNRPFVMRPLQIADLRLAPSTITPTSPETRLIRSDGYVISNDPQH